MPTPFNRDYATIVQAVGMLMPEEADRSERLQMVTQLLWDGLHEHGVDWLGFYEIAPAGDEMTLLCREPKPACSPIALHGVCGKAYLEKRPQIVADVHALGDAHIVCDPENLSEVVVPLFNPGGDCTTVLDLDSRTKGAFQQADVDGLVAVLAAAGLTVADADVFPV